VNPTINALLAIAQRDLTKLLHDRVRLTVSLAFPMLIIMGLGSVLASVSAYVSDTGAILFTGVLAATLFQSAAGGMMSLIQDRETDFSHVLFVAPISRLVIVAGKVAGESAVALVQGLGIIVFAALYGIHMSAGQLALAVPAALVCCLFGAAFGLVILSLLPNQQAALQVLPFAVLPQYFLAGVIAPVAGLPAYLGALSWLMPLRYAVDLTRASFYVGQPNFDHVVMEPPAVDAVVVIALMAGFLLAGALLFERRERGR
jgi:ABC-2 type transport system permease protein